MRAETVITLLFLASELVMAQCAHSQELDEDIHKSSAAIESVGAVLKNDKTKGGLIGGTLTAAATAHPLGFIVGGVAGALIGNYANKDKKEGSEENSSLNEELNDSKQPQEEQSYSPILLTAAIDSCSTAATARISSLKTTIETPEEKTNIKPSAFTLISDGFTAESPRQKQPIRPSLNRHLAPFCFYYQN